MAVSSHYDGSASSYHEQYDPSKLWTLDEYPANLFRLDLVIRLLREAAAQSVYELGAAEGTTLVRIHEALGTKVAGSDLSHEMVRLGRENLVNHGLDAGLLTQVDAESPNALSVEVELRGLSDSVMALGVIPHIENDDVFVSAMTRFVRPGGQLLLQFRNSLFSLFTFNRLTKEFVLDELLIGVGHEFRDAVAADLDNRLAIDLPPKRTRESGDGYDEILSRFHNPFELAEVVRRHGYRDLRFHWYNFHPTYPMIAGGLDPQEYRQAQIDLEADTSWRGMFLCSAGMIIATKDT
jgi:SAM-dependent methyltransferase